MGRAKIKDKIVIVDEQRKEHILKHRATIIENEHKSFSYKTFFQEIEKIADAHKDLIKVLNVEAETGFSLNVLFKYGVLKRRTATPFSYNFTKKQIEVLTNIFNLYISAMPFQISTKQMETILTSYDYIGYIKVLNRPLAFLFDELAIRGMVCNNWQEIIEKNKLFVSRNGKLLTAKNLSVALSRYKDDARQREYLKKNVLEPYRTIKEMLSEL